MFNLGSFGLEFENNIVIFEISTLNFSNYEILQRNKNAYIWDHKCLIWVALGWNMKTILSYLKSAPSNLSNYKIL